MVLNAAKFDDTAKDLVCFLYGSLYVCSVSYLQMPRQKFHASGLAASTAPGGFCQNGLCQHVHVNFGFPVARLVWSVIFNRIHGNICGGSVSD